MELDFERIRIMHQVYEDTVGYQQIIRRAKFLAAVLERKPEEAIIHPPRNFHIWEQGRVLKIPGPPENTWTSH